MSAARVLVLVIVAAQVALAQTSTVPVPSDTTRRRLVARRASGPIVVDGALAEPDWRSGEPAQDFVRVKPDFLPNTPYPSEVRVLYDDRNLYVGAFHHDSAGVSLRVPDLRRDFEPPETDVFGVTFGTLGDHQTAFQFQVTPLGSQGDVQAFDGGSSSNFNWDAAWRVRTTRSDSGWTVEMAIPWTSLRYARGLESWDLNLVRNTRRALQWSAWMPYPRQFSSWRLSYAGALDSIKPPPPGLNMRFRPYVLGQSRHDNAVGGTRASTADVGGEFIWAPTANSLVEATVNTDFAQADVDRQVVNLSRFGVFFPERRQFFLENSDLLSAGGLNDGRYVVQPFFTRRIGLGSDGSLQPILAGARFAYRSGRATAGLLTMRHGEAGGNPAATFGVARVSRFFGRNVRGGVTLATRFDDAIGTTGARQNVVTAWDGFARVGELTQFSGSVSTSTDDGTTGLAATYVARRETVRSGLSVLGALVTKDYNPRTGFVSRSNVLLTSPSATVTLQPANRPRSIVWFKPGIFASIYQDPTSGRLQEASVSLRSEVLHRNGAQWTPFLERNLQRPESSVGILPNVSVAAGSHDYWRFGVDARSDQSARLAASVQASTGTFFDGTLEQVNTSARFSVSPYVVLRTSYEMNRLRSLGTRDTSLVTHLVAPELRVFLNPRVQWSAFYQYNTVQQRGALNARFSWEFLPLSYVYVVYNDTRAVEGGTSPSSRSLIVKLSWLKQL